MLLPIKFTQLHVEAVHLSHVISNAVTPCLNRDKLRAESKTYLNVSCQEVLSFNFDR